jgi:CubicO group peptidase (beta-lactamase class C family)
MKCLARTVMAVLGMAAAQQGVAASLAEAVAQARQSSGAPSLAAVAVTCQGSPEIVVDGLSRIDKKDRLHDDARFNIGSNAKSMLASLAGIYVQDGVLRWDTTVGEVLGDTIAGIDEALAKATLVQLLSHRSGLPGYDTGAELRQVKVEGDTPSRQRLSFARQVLTGAPAYPAGTKFVYSNAGYIVAGVMLERTGGKPFEQLMQDRLFKPLGMHPRFGSPVPPEARQPWGHFDDEGKQKVYEDTSPLIPAFLQPAGDVSLTMADYGSYLREHLCGLRGETTRVLKPATVQGLHRAQGDDGAGMGWGTYELGGTPSSVHVGGTGAFSAFVAIQPARDIAVATVTNSGAESARAAALSLLRTLAEKDQ